MRMPIALRDLVEETIREMMTQFPTTVLDDDEDDTTGQPSMDEIRVLTELVGEGFRKGHVLSALAYIRSARSSSTPTSDPLLTSLASLPLLAGCQEYLHLHVPEEDLPVAFRTSRPPDASVRIATSADSDALAQTWIAERITKNTGAPIGIIVKLLQEAEGDEGTTIDLLLRKLMGPSDNLLLSEERIRANRVGKSSEANDNVNMAELIERRSDEISMLEGMYGDRFRRVDTGLEILVAAPLLKRNQLATDQLVLRVVLHPHSLYPSPTLSPNDDLHLPTFYLYSSTLPAYIVLHLTHLVAAQFVASEREDWLDLAKEGFGGLISEIFIFVESIWKKIVENPPDSRNVLQLLNGAKAVVTGANQGKSTTMKNQPRPRAFKPVPTLAAHLALAKYLELNSVKPAYRKMEAIRANLPAWEMRSQIVNLISNNRVVIVSGETGSGKTTQVPSFVLDDAIMRNLGAATSIIVTQPRRVSAIGVATRVAAERLEDISDPNSRNLIGYAIRGERKASRDCRMLFCTTGVVLARLGRGGDADLDDGE